MGGKKSILILFNVQSEVLELTDGTTVAVRNYLIFCCLKKSDFTGFCCISTFGKESSVWG